MKKTIQILLASAFLIPSLSFAGSEDIDFAQKIEVGCILEAEELADKAARKAVEIQGAWGGNVSAGMIDALNESKRGYIHLQSTLCQYRALKNLTLRRHTL